MTGNRGVRCFDGSCALYPGDNHLLHSQPTKWNVKKRLIGRVDFPIYDWSLLRLTTTTMGWQLFDCPIRHLPREFRTTQNTHDVQRMRSHWPGKAQQLASRVQRSISGGWNESTCTYNDIRRENNQFKSKVSITTKQTTTINGGKVKKKKRHTKSPISDASV